VVFSGLRERIGYIREVVGARARIGRIYPKDGAHIHGYKAEAEAEERG